MIRASETVLRAGPLGAMNRILITVVATVIVTVTEPIGFHTDVCFLALQVIQRTRSIARTTLMSLVRSDVVLAVVDAVAYLRLWDAAIVGAGEFARGAGWVNTSLFVATVATVVLVVALPRFEDAPTVVATELVRAARVIS